MILCNQVHPPHSLLTMNASLGKKCPDKINLTFESIAISINQSINQSTPDDGDSELPKLNLHRNLNFQNDVIQNLQLFHTYIESMCPIYIMSPLVVGDEIWASYGYGG